MPRPYTRDEILDAFRQAVRETSPALTIIEFTRLTGISLLPVRRLFGSWTGLRAAAGLPLGLGLHSAGGKQERREYMLAEATRLAGIHGERLTLERFCREAGVSVASVFHYFESWRALRRAAGLTTPRANSGSKWTAQAILEEYERVTRQLGWCPGLYEFVDRARCSTTPVIQRFGGIRGLEAAYRGWLQHRARQPGPDAQLARHLLEWCVDLTIHRP